MSPHTGTHAKSWTVFLLCLVFIATLTSACGGSESGGDAASGESGRGESGRGESGAATSGSSGGDLPDSAAPEGEIAMSEAESGDEIPDGDFDRKIIKTADLGIRAGNVREAASEAGSVADDFGGSVLESSVDRGGGSVSADLVLSIPSPEFDDALGELRGLGEEVATDAVRGEDVTEEFVDLESRERNLLAAEESLLELYDDVENVREALAIERELSGVRGEIELVQGRIKYLEERTSSARISLDIHPVEEPVEAAWNPAEVAANAWGASLGVLRTAANAAISTVVFGWWIAPFLIVGFVWWRRRGSASAS